MCAISGIYSFQDTVDLGLLRRISARQKRRGPDGGSLKSWGSCALAHERLSIIDLQTGTQPLLSEDGRSGVVVNGEIYNHKQLRFDLERKGHRFSSRSDSEVVLHGYEEEGTSFFRKLDGMFAFALWDGHRQQLVLGRDLFGKKPLVYASKPEGLAFASTIQALKEWGSTSPLLSQEALSDYLRFRYVTDEHSIYQGFVKVPAGHAVVVDANNKITTMRFTSFPEPGRFEGSYQDAQDLLRQLLRSGVQKRLESDVPLGLLLSAGIDSSLIASEVAALGGKLKTFTLGFKGLEDERATARSTAEHFGLEHQEEEMDLDMEAGFREAVQCYDEPFADSSAIATFSICRFAKQHVTVALCGDGGDEGFAGYSHFRLWAASQSSPSGLWQHFQNQMRWQSSRLMPSTTKRAWREPLQAWRLRSLEPDPWLRWLKLREVFSQRQASELTGFSTRLSEYRDGFSLRDAEEYDWQHYLRSDLLVKVDRASMYHGMELRSPFLDDDLARFARQLPLEWKISGDGRGKKIVRETFHQQLPEALWQRPKSGFQVPVKKWLKNPAMQKRVHDLHDLNNPLWKHLDFQVARNFLDRYKKGSGNEQQIWSILVLSEWMKGTSL